MCIPVLSFVSTIAAALQYTGQCCRPKTCYISSRITADVRVYVLQQDNRIVSFLLSSTFTDTEWERNLLIDDVVPYLQDYARKHGFEFRLAEMRW